jgi:glycosyltransferase involved in cell wall biosynthesis
MHHKQIKQRINYLLLKKVTIIVPFYNVEQHIGECLNSLINQTHTNIEILCIDDCSSDNSLGIATSYATKDSRINITRLKKNTGQGKARNIGIKHATGDYICFVDSDDYVCGRFVELLYKAIRKDDSDIAICYYWQDEQGIISPYGTNRANGTLEIKINKDNTLEIARQFNPGCTNRIYKRDLLIQHNIFQPEQRYYEDVMFWLLSVYYSRKISIISDRLYYYRQRQKSTMNSLSHHHIDDRFEFIKQIDSFVKNSILPTPGINTSKMLEDTLLYILIHIHYGKTLIDNSCLDSKKELEEYYANKIIDFAKRFDWPSLQAMYDYYIANKIIS